MTGGPGHAGGQLTSSHSVRREGDAAQIRVDLVVEQLRRSVPGGIGTYCRGLLQGLQSLPEGLRPDVTLRASRNPSRNGTDDPLARLGWPLRTSPLPGVALTRVWDAGIPAGWLGSRLSRPRDRIVHATSLATPPVTSVPTCAMVHDLAWRRFPEAYPPRGREWHERTMQRLAKRARVFVVPSELTARDLLSAGLGIGEHQVRIVAEGVDHMPSADDEAADALLEQLGVGARAGFLMTVGTLEPRKNLARLLQAYELARADLPAEWPLLVVGPRGWAEGGKAVATAGVSVIPTGPLEAPVLAALYRRARCMAYVPLFEGFGLPAAEAMLAGAPVVATDGLPSAGDAALAVDPEDTAGIARSLVTASVDGPERDRLRAAGELHARSLTWERCAAAHVAIWAQMAA